MTKIKEYDCCIYKVAAESVDAYHTAARGIMLRVENTDRNAAAIKEWTERQELGGGYCVLMLKNPEDKGDWLPEVKSFLIDSVSSEGIVLARLSENQKYWIIVAGEQVEIVS